MLYSSHRLRERTDVLGLGPRQGLSMSRFVPRKNIGWTEVTLNPVPGCWGPGGIPEQPRWCSYCYARRIAVMRGYSFVPTFLPQRLKWLTPRQRPRFIFIGSMGDLFGDWVPADWIKQVVAATQRAPQHVYQFLTKNPERLAEFNPWPSNCWVGASAVDQAMTNRAVGALAKVKAPVRFISFEPLLGECSLVQACQTLELSQDAWPVDWIIIGALSGPKGHQPPPAWVRRLTGEADGRDLPVFYKASLKAANRRQDFPARPVATWQRPGRGRGQRELFDEQEAGG